MTDEGRLGTEADREAGAPDRPSPAPARPRRQGAGPRLRGALSRPLAGPVADGFPWRLLTVDIDGTLTRTHGWKEIARTFDRLPEFERTNREFRAGRLEEDTHIADFLRIAQGHTLAELQQALERTPKLAGISEGIALLHDRGVAVALLTHNPDYVVEWYRQRFRFDDGEGVGGQPVVGGRIGPPVGIHADKPAELARLLARHRVPAACVAHVGDSASDAQVFPLVGGGIALNAASPAVERAADLAIRTEDFRRVVEGLQRIRPRPVSDRPTYPTREGRAGAGTIPSATGAP